MVKKILILLSLISILGCGSEKTVGNTPKRESLKIVKSVDLKRESLANIKNYNGELKPQKEMKIVTPTGGDIKNIYFKNGDRVKKGEIIAEIYNADVEAKYYEAQGKLLKARSKYSMEKTSFGKYEKLYQGEIISEEDYLNVKNRYETAQGDLKIAEGSYLKAKDDYDRLKVISKIDGIVTDLFVKKYERVESGKEIVNIVDNSHMEVDIAVSGSDVEHSKFGNIAEIYVEELGEKRIGIVTEINLSSDSNSKKYSLRLVVENKDGKILKGMYAKVNLQQGEISGIFVPTKAVMIKDLYSYIAIIRNGKAIIYKVDPKITLGDMQMIEFADYKEGDRVVVEGQYLLNNNDKVKES